MTANTTPAPRCPLFGGGTALRSNITGRFVRVIGNYRGRTQVKSGYVNSDGFTVTVLESKPVNTRKFTCGRGHTAKYGGKARRRNTRADFTFGIGQKF